MSQVESRLHSIGLKLPEPAKPLAAYVPTVRTGNLVFISGQGPKLEGKMAYVGRVGSDLTLEEGKKAAELCALNALAALKAEIGDLDKVKRVVKVLGWVNSAPDFTDQPLVMNGASELLEKIFGEKGKHARSAVSAHVLPANITVEVEMIVEVED
ncbi:MAG TPA: RidA family protein [Firmicutes bacterium]|nr:RidA family protein [Bacillota bacterium]